MKSELTQNELNRIFIRKIRPSFDRKIARFPAATPTLVMVGAQPGAGKSRSMTRVLTEYPGAIPVIGDDFRAFHPSYDDLMSSPETVLQMPQVTAQAAARCIRFFPARAPAGSPPDPSFHITSASALQELPASPAQYRPERFALSSGRTSPADGQTTGSR